MKLGKLMIGWMITCVVLGLGSAWFVIWLIMKLLSHFGII